MAIRFNAPPPIKPKWFEKFTTTDIGVIATVIVAFATVGYFLGDYRAGLNNARLEIENTRLKDSISGLKDTISVMRIRSFKQSGEIPATPADTVTKPN